MAQNLQQLPPSKRFKILNSEPMSMSQPLRETDKHNRNSLPAKKCSEVLGNSSTSSFLPAKKRLEIDLNTAPSTSACIPKKKHSENPNCSSTSACLPAKKRFENLNCSSSSSCLPAKKRVEILNISSTSNCLPAKKRIWAPHLLSPAKSGTQTQGADLVIDKGKVVDGEASNGVPVKKRAWARILASPPEPVNQSPVADPICADAKSETKGANQLPAKKRVWIFNPLTQSSPEPKVEVPDLNSVPEKDQINDVKEKDPNPASTTQQDTTEKPISAPNPLSEIQEGTTKTPVPDPNPLSPIQEDEIKKQISETQQHTTKEPLAAPKPLSAIEEDTSQKRVSSPNPLPEIHENTTKKRVSDPNPLTPTSLGFEEKCQIKAKGAKETHGVPAKKRVSAPKPLSANRDVTAKKRIGLENPLTSAVPGIQKGVTNLKSVQEKDAIRDLKKAKEIQGLTSKKRVWAPNLLSPTTTQTEIHINNGEAIDEVPSKKKVRYVHQLSPIAEEKAQTEHQAKLANETTTVLVKKRIWAPEPLASAKTQLEPNCDPKPVKLTAKNEFELDGGDEIHGDPLILACAMHPLSPVKTETQNEEKGSESIEEEIDDGVLCAVCQSTDGEPSDPIVFCDGCDLMVHASCYGNPLIKSIPEGDWFCSACSSKDPRKEKRCCLCPVKGGALKPTVDRKWAHVMCALLVPEVFFGDPEGRDGIDCSRVPDKRWQKDCFICGRSCGCAIDCAESKCKLGFHVSCGLEEGLSIEYKEGKGGDIVAGFCTEHTKLWKKQQSTGKFKIVSKD